MVNITSFLETSMKAMMTLLIRQQSRGFQECIISSELACIFIVFMVSHRIFKMFCNNS